MTEPKAPIKVLLVDDHNLVRIGVGRILADQPDIKAVSVAGSGEEALDICRRRGNHFDVVLMDINMPGIGGIETMRQIRRRWPKLPVIILTMHIEDPYPQQLLQAGAAGYLSKAASVDEIVSAIREVRSGRRYIGNDVARGLAVSILPTINTGYGDDDRQLQQLSQREFQVMSMLIDGLRPQDIATTLNISPKTVSTYRRRIFNKLGLASEAALINFAHRHRIHPHSLI